MVPPRAGAMPGACDPGDAAAPATAALRDAAAVLAALWAAKWLAPVPVLGPAALTGAAFVQLYLPMRACERGGRPYAAVGLTLAGWRGELVRAARVAAVVLPLYALGWHVMVTAGRAAAARAGLWALAEALPVMAWQPPWPADAAGWGAAGWEAVGLAATHVAGVALPEETFYRGYLQPALAARWPARVAVAGVPMGRAVVLSCALFALGHYLGEWHPARLLPFFPGLLFGWVRGRGASVVGCAALHAGCNLASAALLALYR